MRRIPSLILAVLCTISNVSAQVSLTRTCIIEFADVSDGRVALRKSDAFINSLSRFDKQARLKTKKDISTKQFLDFVSSHVREWKKDDRQKLRKVISEIRPKLARFDLPFPKTVQLVHTSGMEEGGAAYCRGNSIVLPTGVLRRKPKQLETLIIHELFHVMSSHNPALRQELYAIVGFKPCGVVDLPESLADRRITNPDAPSIEHAVTLSIEGKNQKAVPILYASVANYVPEEGKSFFRYMQFRLMVVKKQGKRFRPLLHDGKPVLLDPKNTPSYFDKIGHNTQYIIHAEEVLADNFVHLISGTTDLSTPRIVDEMRRILRR